jgi:ArsR family transcriptional regulator, arsenate/arsenite/antimonite-responsive transcriptional repressor / arsenate reductase (thioredoxin)
VTARAARRRRATLGEADRAGGPVDAMSGVAQSADGHRRRDRHPPGEDASNLLDVLSGAVIATARADTPAPPRFLRLAGHPLRWRLLSELARSDRRVGELCELAGQRQSLVSYHLRQLRDGGVVSARRSLADGRDSYYVLELARCGELLVSAGASLHPGLAPAVGSHTGRERGLARGRVLFVCTGNSARSQMAEALAEQLSAGAVRAVSAGSHPKPLHPNAVRVMRARGIDLAGRRSKPLSEFTGRRFDYVISLCDRVREICPEFPGTPQAIHWSLRDPAREPGSDDETLPAFERTAAELETRIGFLLAAINHTTGTQEVIEHA